MIIKTNKKQNAYSDSHCAESGVSNNYVKPEPRHINSISEPNYYGC